MPNIVNIIKNLRECIKNDVTEPNNYNGKDVKPVDESPSIPQNAVTGVTLGVTGLKPERYPDCGIKVDPFNKNIHLACCKAFINFPAPVEDE